MVELLLSTPSHDLCGRDGRGRPRPCRKECATILLDAGTAIAAKDEEYRSTPLAWAACNDLPDMVDLLLARGAPTNLADDDPGQRPSRGRPSEDITASSRSYARPARPRKVAPLARRRSDGPVTR